MGRRRRDSGSVLQRTYRDAKGKNRKTKNWYIEFVAGGRRIADGERNEVELTGLGRPARVAGFEPSISSRFSTVHRRHGRMPAIVGEWCLVS
jgi:hypothetical protein